MAGDMGHRKSLFAIGTSRTRYFNRIGQHFFQKKIQVGYTYPSIYPVRLRTLLRIIPVISIEFVFHRCGILYNYRR